MKQHNYLALLQEDLVPAWAALFPNPLDPDLPDERIWYQQDGAPPHYAVIVRRYLEEVFPNWWIRRRDQIEWPARSPDLTPLDFFFMEIFQEQGLCNKTEQYCKP
jgi:hypothetical protein